MVQNIHIQINRLKLYKVSVSNALNINVIKDEPFDDLSNRFNKYRHIPKYSPQTDYDPKDYVLCLDDPNAWYYTYILYLYEPTIQIVSVDIFFDSNDKERRNPLIFGFNQVDNTSLYYSYYFLRGIKYFTGTLSKNGLIKKEDLITRLIDERGLYISESYNKFVIRLGDKPNKSEIKYPNSGQHKERITLKKSEPEKYDNYVKFEHVINKLNNVESFYISFHQDTLYMIAESNSGKLKEVDVYYNKHDGEIPVVVVFKFASRTKLYKFSDLHSDFSKKTKKISDLTLFSDSDLDRTLIEEFKRVKKEITFKKGSGTNRYISETAHRFHLGHMDEFRRVILKPKLDKSKGGDPTGPYEIFNDNLLKKYSATKIPDYYLNSLHNKNFSSIYIYFTSHYEPLLIGFISESEKIFFKISKGGKSWEKEDTVKIYSDSELIPKLRDLEKVSNVSVSHGKVQVSGPSHKPGRVQPRPSAPPISTQYETVTIKIDISDTAAGSSYEYGKVQFGRKDYDGCDLFYYFTHSLKDKSSFTISSLTLVKFDKRITNIADSHKMVKSVHVYFNRYNLNRPVILGITPDNGNTVYYKSLVQSGSTYPFSTLKKVNSESLTDELINEADEVNQSLTYQLDKINDKTPKYGHNSLISLTKDEDAKHEFRIFTHKQSTGKTLKGYVLFNNKTLLGWSNNRNKSLNIQNKHYTSIKVYFLNTDQNLPLLLEFLEQSIATYYIKNTDEKGEYWTDLNIKFDGDESIKSKLIEINYPLKHSVVVEIDKNSSSKDRGFNYPMKIISNKRSSDNQYVEIQYEKSKLIESKSVEVSNTNTIADRSNRSQKSFYYVSHELEKSNSQSINRKDIAGVRLFITNSLGSKIEEIFFYENESNAKISKDPLVFYYPPNSVSQKIFVYFHDDDPRPLLVSYDGHIYKRLNNDDHTRWVRAGKANYSDFSEQLKILKTIFGSLDKKLTLLEEGEIDANIKETKNERFGSYKKDNYTVKLSINVQKTSFKLPLNKLVYNLQKDNSLYKLFDNIFNKSFDSINVYKSGDGLTVKDILVFELLNDSRTTHFQRKDLEGKYWVEEEIVYDDSNDLQRRLQVIRSKVEKTIVYEIDKKIEHYNQYINMETSSSELSYEYTEYSHSPQSNYYNFYGYVLYRGERLMVKNSHAQIVPLDSVQDEPYINVSVYFGSRKEEVPLILEFTFSNSSHSKTYYKHMKYESRSYWELIKIRSGISELQDLISQLKLVESNLFQSVVILMDIRKGKYGDTKIKDAIPKLTNKKTIDTYPMDQECITVSDRTHQYQSNCLTNSGFGVIEHNINNCIKDKHTCLLRFFIRSNKSSNNYTELNLYDDSSLDTLFYSKPSGDSKIYIYYYYGTKNRYGHTEDHDPRPLLLSYGNAAYKAKNKDGYFESWYKVSNITDFLCQRSGGNPQLIRALSEVAGFLNEVQLQHRPNNPNEQIPKRDGSETKTYDIHTYNNEQIKIQVSYHNGSCFRYYRHEPYGINGRSQGFRLGNISYDNKQASGLTYEISKQLKAVNLFYSLYDYSHTYPLFVSLEFWEGDNDEYFELNDKRVKKWRRIYDNLDDENIEYRIKSLIKNLQLDLNTGKEARTLFESTECYEDSGTSTTTIAAASGGTVTTAALVGGGVTLATHPEWVIPVLKALT